MGDIAAPVGGYAYIQINGGGWRGRDEGETKMSSKITEHTAMRWISGEMVEVRWFSVEVFDAAGKLRSYFTTSSREAAENAAAKF